MVPNTDYKNQYTYTGIDDYEISFDYDVVESLVVNWIDTSGVVSEPPKTLDIDYEVVNVDNVVYCRVLVDFGTGGEILIYRDIPLTQTWEGVDGTTPPPSGIMLAIDRVVWQVQQLFGQLSGTLKTPANETADMTVPSAGVRADSIAGYGPLPDALPIAFASVPAAATSTYVEGGLNSVNEAAFKSYYDVADADLAGVGRTTENVKANADAIALNTLASTQLDPIDIVPHQIAGGGMTSIVVLTPDRIVGFGNPISRGVRVTTAQMCLWERNADNIFELIGYNVVAGLTLPRQMVRLNDTTLAANDYSANIQTIELSGSTFVLVGSAYTETDVIEGICSLDSSSIAIVSVTSNELSKLSWSGTLWTVTGNPLSLSNTGGAMAALNSDTVAYINETTDDIRVYSFDGSDWSQEGNPYSLGTIIAPSIIGLTSTRVVVNQPAGSKILTLDWDGSDFTLYDSFYAYELGQSGGIIRNGRTSDTSFVWNTAFGFADLSLYPNGRWNTSFPNEMIFLHMVSTAGGTHFFRTYQYLDETHIFAVETTDDRLYMWEKDATYGIWELVGNYYTETALTEATRLDDSHVVVSLGTSSWRVLEWDGNDFNTVGNLLALGTNVVLIGAQSNTKILGWAASAFRVYDWDGTDLTLLYTVTAPDASYSNRLAMLSPQHIVGGFYPSTTIRNIGLNPRSAVTLGNFPALADWDWYLEALNSDEVISYITNWYETSIDAIVLWNCKGGIITPVIATYEATIIYLSPIPNDRDSFVSWRANQGQFGTVQTIERATGPAHQITIDGS